MAMKPIVIEEFQTKEEKAKAGGYIIGEYSGGWHVYLGDEPTYRIYNNKTTQTATTTSTSGNVYYNFVIS